MFSPHVLPLPLPPRPSPPQHHLHPEVFPPHRLPLRKKEISQGIFSKTEPVGSRSGRPMFSIRLDDSAINIALIAVERRRMKERKNVLQQQKISSMNQ